MGLVLGKKREEKEIKELVPRKIETLVRALQDKNTAIRRIAARTLQQKANLESLTGEAVKALEAALSDADKKVRMHSAGALTYHYLDNENWEKIGGLIKNKDIEGVVNSILRDANVSKEKIAQVFKKK